MHILICGNISRFSRRLIRRLHQEKHEVYLLHSPHDPAQADRDVFHEYRFPMTSSSVLDAITSAAPEVMVIQGAEDPQYTWHNPAQDATEYVLGITRLIMAARDAKVPRVLYISTEEVFEINDEAAIDCATAPASESAMQAAVLKGEDFLRGYADETMEIGVIRFPKIIGSADQPGNVIGRMLVDAQKDGIVHCVKGQKHAVIDFRDAADAMCRIIRQTWEQRKMLCMVEGCVVTDDEICACLGNPKWGVEAVPFFDSTASGSYPPERIVEFINPALEFTPRYGLEQIVDSLYRDFLENQKVARSREKRGLTTYLPFIENLVLGILTTVLTGLTSDTVFGKNLNYFTFYVLLIAASYGLSHGLLSVVVSGFGMVVLGLLNGTLYEELIGFDVFIRFLGVVVVCVIAGFIRDKYFRKNNNLGDENHFLQGELTDITRINDGNVYIKDVYEKRLINYQNSLARVYELTEQLDYMVPQKVVFQATRVIQELMEVDRVAIYTIAQSGSKFYRLTSSTGADAEVCGKSMVLDEKLFCYEAFMRGEVYCNRSMDASLPTYACTIGSGDGVRAFVLIWTADLDKVNNYESNMLVLLCRLAEKSMNRAFDYEEAIRADAYIGDTRFMKSDSFLAMFDIWHEGMQQGLFTYTLLQIDPVDQPREKLEKLCRRTDLLGIVDGVPYLMLASTSSEEAQVVLNRIREAGMVPILRGMELPVTEERV